MAFAAPTKSKQATTNLAKSTWTPMNNSEANLQVFEERRALLKKWFEKWGEKQRRAAVNDVIKCLSEKHMFALLEQLTQKFPQEKYDFTKRLPRVLSLYVFSFLDPRSLCRCAQVSWYWKYLTELDCLWRPKCLRFGWYATHQPSQYEETVWKRHYVTTLYGLHYVKAKEEERAEKQEGKIVPDSARSLKSQLSTTRSNVSSASRRKKAQIAPKYVALPGPIWEPPPWKGSDPNPTDTMRYNYLDNSTKDKKKSKERRRPNSASGSILISSRSHGSPVKSSGEPGASYSASASRKKDTSSVAQSLDPRVLGTGTIHGGTLATSRNMMSSSVSHLTYTGNTGTMSGSPGLHGNTLTGGTLAASTYYINSSSPVYSSMDGTFKTPTQDVSSTLLHGQTPEQSPEHMYSSSLRMTDAGKRPQSAVRISTEKPGTMTSKQAGTIAKVDPSRSKEITNVAMSTEYQVKSSGKSTPLQGSPWKPPENNISDDD